MRIVAKCLAFLALLFLAALLLLNVWGALTLGKLAPPPDAYRDAGANNTVMVFGATGSVGDGLLKAAMAAPGVETIYAVTRSLSPRLEAGAESGRVRVIMHEDFTDYSELADTLAGVNTVMWALGASSIGMDAATYRRIHVDFPVAFVNSWLAARTEGPMAFHYVTGMGTGEEESARWARDKGFAERRVAELAANTGLRTFGHRSAWIRPTREHASWLVLAGEHLLRPGNLVIRSMDLGRAMLEISARTRELPNGSLIDNRDAIDYARLYRERVDSAVHR